MAIYHASIKSFSRGKGESSVAAAAYRAGLDLVDTKTREVHRYSFRKGVAAYFMLAPAGAPKWCSDVNVFWDANQAHESRSNARVARELEVSLPGELGPKQREALAIELGQILVDRYQAVVLVAIHLPSQEGDNRNHHVHLLMSARQVLPDGFGDRAGAEFDARGGRGGDEIRVVRELVSKTINDRLAAENLEDRVDHRSLQAQSLAAAFAGDHQKAAELSREPGRHMGKAITEALRRRRGQDVLSGIAIASPAQAAMDEAVERFTSRGRLAEPSAARQECARKWARDMPVEGGQTQSAGSVATKPLDARSGRMPIIQTPSRIALHLSRQARISRSQGKDADILNAEAKLIEEWLASQIEAAQDALESMMTTIPGLQLEQEMKDAMTTALRRRVGVYASKPFFFEDSEVLTAAIVEYAAAIRHPQEMEEKVWRARVKLSELKDDGVSDRDPRMEHARKRYVKAKSGISKPAKVATERRINEARAVMTAARDAMERDYYVTPLDRIETSPPQTYTAGPGGGERKSDSNRRELKPQGRPKI